MSKVAIKKSPLIGLFLLVTVLLTLAGCGDAIHWFPGGTPQQPTDPNAFSFPSKTNVAVNTVITSDPITVAGLTAATSPISVTGPSGSDSKFSINGGAASSATGQTVKNGDTVTVSHNSGSSAGLSVTSTLTIGGVSGTFTTTTRSLDVTFGNASSAGGNNFVKGTVHLPGSGSHTISIRDTGSNTSQYSVGNTVSFTNVEQTLLLNNNEDIFVLNGSAAVNSGVVTTLTIDNTDFTVPLKRTAKTTTTSSSSSSSVTGTTP